MSKYPKDWVEVKIEDIISIQPFIKYISKDESKVGKYPIIQQGDNPIFGYSSDEPYFQFECSILFGDHTLSLYKPSKPFLLKSDGIKILKCSPNLDSDFLYYLLKNYMPEYQGYKRHYSILKRIKVLLPLSKAEQKAIAETLMAFDEHIENLEELIAKKKMIRNGAVEDLMRGKTRLDGFDGEWETVLFDKVMSFLNGLTYSPGDVRKSGVLVLRSSNIQNDVITYEDNVFVNEESVTSEKVQIGDIILCVRNGSKSLIGKNAIIKNHVNATIGAFMSCLRCNQNIYDRFAYYHLKTADFSAEVDRILGATINQITKKDLKRMSIYIPKDIKEQQAIADILTAMDEEIEDLIQEKEKIEKIKLGAMDDLLTGRIRLVKEA